MGCAFTTRPQAKGPQIAVFVHGWPGCWLRWEETLRRLPRNVLSYSLDVRGAGLSERPVGGYTIEQYAADVIGFADALGLERFAYVGHSTGGAVGYQLALAHPERLDALVLVDPAAANGEQADAAAMRRFLERAHDPAGLRHFVASRVFARPVAPELLDMVVEWALKTSDGYFVDTIYALQRLRLGDRLGEIEVRTLILAGAEDRVVAREAIVKAADTIPDCALHLLEGAGHAPMLEAPDAFAKLLVGFLDSVRSVDEGTDLPPTET
jgi:pimeloyl-ACP methyl ester carboxylesterase